MGLFSRKKSSKHGLSDDNAYDDVLGILPFETADEDDFWNLSPVNVQAPKKHGLTANEILGKEAELSDTQSVSAEEEEIPVAPSQKLFERMVISSAPLEKDPEIKPQQEEKPIIKEDIPAKKDISLTAELNGLIEN